MLKSKTLALLLISLLLLTACQAPAATADTTALEARIATLESQVNGAEGGASAGDVAALTNRITALEEAATMGEGMAMDHGDGEMDHGAPAEEGTPEETMDHGATTEHGAEVASMSHDPLFAVTMATYMMDTAGFHGMDDAINGESTIDPAYVGTVNRVAQLISVTPWPADLAEEAMTFQATLVEFAEVLGNDDVEGAKPLATRVHEEQHDFSHNIGAWINSQMGVEGDGHDH